jgi:hypothetical protein
LPSCPELLKLSTRAFVSFHFKAIPAAKVKQWLHKSISIFVMIYISNSYALHITSARGISEGI